MAQGQSHLPSLSPPFVIHILAAQQGIANKFHVFDHRKVQLFQAKAFLGNLPTFSRHFIWGGHFHFLRFQVKLRTFSKYFLNQLDKNWIGKRQGNQRDGQKKIQFEIKTLEILLDDFESLPHFCSQAFKNFPRYQVFFVFIPDFAFNHRLCPSILSADCCSAYTGLCVRF